MSMPRQKAIHGESTFTSEIFDSMTWFILYIILYF